MANNRQLQTIRNTNRSLDVVRPARPRSLWGNTWTLALQPSYFFQTLPQAADTRQWFWVAVLIIALIGWSAVREEQLRAVNGGGGAGAPVIPDFGGVPIDPGAGGGGGFDDLGGIPPGGIPEDFGAVPLGAFGGDAGGADISTTWVTFLIGISHTVLGWGVLAILLCVVSLFNGQRPTLGQNLQIAIWSALPFGIMAGLQLVFWSGGGRLGESGISGLLTQWEPYATLNPTVQALLMSLTARTTLFWLWSLLLIWFGARQALNGNFFAVLLVILMWISVLVFAPVLTGSIAAPEQELPPELMLPGEGVPGEGMPLPDGSMVMPDGSIFMPEGGEQESIEPLPDGMFTEVTLSPEEQAMIDEAGGEVEATAEADANAVEPTAARPARPESPNRPGNNNDVTPEATAGA
jgi:hypothetical protein